jgi:hypothetical protein
MSWDKERLNLAIVTQGKWNWPLSGRLSPSKITYLWQSQTEGMPSNILLTAIQPSKILLVCIVLIIMTLLGKVGYRRTKTLSWLLNKKTFTSMSTWTKSELNDYTLLKYMDAHKFWTDKNLQVTNVQYIFILHNQSCKHCTISVLYDPEYCREKYQRTRE